MKLINLKSSLLCLSIVACYNFSYTQKGNNSVEWSEFSFLLKPSPLGGIGVFATHDIPAGTQIFKEEFNLRKLKIKEVPEELIKYCIYTDEEECLCPERFDRMEIGWYINHSATPNIAKRSTVAKDHLNDLKKRDIYAIQDIKAGDEILIDYNYLNEPEDLKEDYYKLS